MAEHQDRIVDHSVLKRRGRRDKKEWKHKRWEFGPNDNTWQEIFPGHEVEINWKNQPTGLIRTSDNRLPRFSY